MRLNVRKLQIVGATPDGYRRIGVVPGGSFDGDRLSGEVLDGGNDWQTVRPDGATTLNVRLVLKTKDDALICMTYYGVRHGPPDVVVRIEKGEAVGPTSYYFRIKPLCETAAAAYDGLRTNEPLVTQLSGTTITSAHSDAVTKARSRVALPVSTIWRAASR